MALSTVSSGTSADASDLNQVVEALIGTAGAGQPISLTALNDATNFALDVRNQDTTNARAFRVRDSSNSARLQVTSSGPEADPSGAGTLSRIVTETGASTLTNKTFNNSTLGSSVGVALGSDATGDIWYRNSSGQMGRLGIGSSGQHVESSGGLPVWAAGSKMRIIGDTVLTSTAASITFSAIPSTFASLQMHILSRTDTAIGIDLLLAYFNNDTAANYHSQINRSSALVSTSAVAIGSTQARVGISLGSSGTDAGSFGQTVVSFPYYASTVRKIALFQSAGVLSTAVGGLRCDDGRVFWDSTAAISTITIVPNNAGFAAGSRVTLWGLST